MAKPSAGEQRVWFNSRQAMAYVPCPTLNAWYMWRNRHGIIPRANGSVARADIDRVLNLRNKKRRRVSAKSLENLRLRHTRPAEADVDEQRTA